MNPANYSVISFPWLGLELNPGRGFNIGPFSANFYGLVIACGLLLAAWYGMKRAKTFGFAEDDILDGVLWVTPFAILCARAYYCIFSWESYAANPISVLYIWEGGLAIYGGVLGAAVGVTVFCIIKKLKLPALLDLVSIGFLIGQSIGRWGNFMNREAFGAQTEIFCRMGLTAPNGTTIYVHPTFLYESLWNLLLLIGLIIFERKGKRRYDGQCTLLYFFFYGLGRMWIEGLRTDSLYIGSTGIRVSQLLSLGLVLASGVTMLIIRRRNPDPAKLHVNVVKEEKQNTSPEIL